jgi:protein-L-isoaspartate(D-aspartate) O-methyltransferase
MSQNRAPSGGSRGRDARVLDFLHRYTDELREAGAIRSRAVELAFGTVERHRLVEGFSYWGAESQERIVVQHDPERPITEHLEVIYSNTALATRFVDEMPASSSSQPSLVAEMLELLELAPGMKILEIGAGTGYGAALMSEIVGDQRLVVSVDVLEGVVEQTKRLLRKAGYQGVDVLLRDGFEGVAEAAPFDRIVGTVGCSDLSPHWKEQLADDGILLVPLEHAGGHPLILVRREDGLLRGRIAAWSAFLPASGALRIDGLWASGTVRPGPEDSVEQQDPWPGFGSGGTLASLGSSSDEIDLLFFLGLQDNRACWAPHGVGLSEGASGWVVASPDSIRWWKNRSLVDELDRYYEKWVAAGRPKLKDYRVSFLGIEDEGTAPAAPWYIRRRFFLELVDLDG